MLVKEVQNTATHSICLESENFVYILHMDLAQLIILMYKFTDESCTKFEINNLYYMYGFVFIKSGGLELGRSISIQSSTIP